MQLRIYLQILYEILFMISNYSIFPRSENLRFYNMFYNVCTTIKVVTTTDYMVMVRRAQTPVARSPRGLYFVR